MKAVSACLLACVGLLAAACGPKTYNDVWAAASEADKAGDHKKAYRLCERSLGMAHQQRRGSWAIWSLECHARSASRLGKMGAPPSAYAIVVENYPQDLSESPARHRLRNDYGVALSMAGKEDEAITALEKALTEYKGTPLEKGINVWERMYIVRNLGKVHAKKGASAASTAFANEWADEIEALIARERQVDFRVGTGAALEVIADLMSDNNPARAAKLREMAAEEREREAFYWARSTNTARKRCHNIFIFDTPVDRCFLEVPGPTT